MKKARVALRLLGFVIATAICTLPGRAATPDPFDTALENGDFVGAQKEIDRVADRIRPRTGTHPLLDSYYGRYFAAVANGQVARPYLERAISGATDPATRDKLAFELARSQEVDGFVADAEKDYRGLLGTTEPSVRRDAALALARLRLGAAPEEAIRLLSPLTDPEKPAGARWEAHLLLSRSYAIQGRSAEASAALSAAWQEAPSAPVPADAIALTAMDMAMDHVATNDRAAETGLVAISRTTSRFEGVSQLPVCGDTLRSDDSVIVAIAPDAKQRISYSAVRASRSGIAQLFTVALATTTQRVESPAIYVTLRCRASMDAGARIALGYIPSLPSWLAERGFYPPMRTPDISLGDPIGQLKTQLDAVRAKLGSDSPALVPLLLQLAAFQAAQGRLSNQAFLPEGKANLDRVFAILAKAGAPIEVTELLRVQTTVLFAQGQNLPDVAGPATMRVMEAMAARPETSPDQALLLFDGVGQWQLRPAQRLALADRIVTFFDARKVPATAPLRQALELRRAAILRDLGTLGDLGDRLAASGLAADLCAAVDHSPAIPPDAITLTSDDYPKDLLRRDVTGATSVELAVDAAGKIVQQRILASQPSGLFDAITTEKLKSVTLIPAQRGDRPVACRGLVQRVRWQIPFRPNFGEPFGSLSPLPAD